MPVVKQAVIVYGKRFSGRNYTLNCHFKPLVKLNSCQRIFHRMDSLTNRLLDGEIRTQSLEEAGYTVQSVAGFIQNKLADRDRLVVVTLPPSEADSLFDEVRKTLMSAGYEVASVEIINKGVTLNPGYYAGKAAQILQCI